MIPNPHYMPRNEKRCGNARVVCSMRELFSALKLKDITFLKASLHDITEFKRILIRIYCFIYTSLVLFPHDSILKWRMQFWLYDELTQCMHAVDWQNGSTDVQTDNPGPTSFLDHQKYDDFSFVCQLVFCYYD